MSIGTQIMPNSAQASEMVTCSGLRARYKASTLPGFRPRCCRFAITALTRWPNSGYVRLSWSQINAGRGCGSLNNLSANCAR
ncbi:hypothetical protein D3C71_1743360 [compost metagenome]